MSDKQVTAQTSPIVKSLPLSLQIPKSESSPHFVNYIKEFSRLLRRHRVNLPDNLRSAENFGSDVLGMYLGGSVSRDSIRRIENGNLSVAWGVVASYLDHMKLWPELLAVMLNGNQQSLHHMLLVYNELKRNISQEDGIAEDKLNRRALQERRNGIVK